MSEGGAHSSDQARHDVTANAELLLRLISALVLAAVAITVTAAGVWPFVALLTLGAIVTTWEWSRMVRGSGFDAAAFCQSSSVVAAVCLTAAGRIELGVLALGLGLGGVGWLSYSRSNAKWSLIGVPYIGAPFIAVTALRSDPDMGWLAVVFLFSIVWSADSAAYAFGRLLGGPKLARRVSPKKTWSGFAGGIGVPAVVGYCWGLWLAGTSPLALALLAAGLSLAAQFGDLAESAAKRRFRIKDSSELIPGHGGMLDRIDGLLFAALAAGLVALARQSASPGAALLFWP